MKRQTVAVFIGLCILVLVIALGQQGDQYPTLSPLLTQNEISDWTGAVQRDLLQTEYAVSQLPDVPLTGQTAVYQAPNRVHNLRTYFAPAGIQVVSRTEETPTWSWGLHLASYSQGDGTQLIETAEPSAAGKSVTYRRGSIREQYVNDEQGVRQRLTVLSPPSGQPADLLYIDLALTGNLQPAVAGDGQTVNFVTADGRPVLQYGQLTAQDARRQLLPANLQVTSGVNGQPTLRLSVETADVLYPLSLTQEIITPDWIAGAGQNAQFGFSVSIAGDVNGDGFDDVIVGAPWYDAGAPNMGAAFLYLGSPGGLSPAYHWKVVGPEADGQLGYAVSGAGDVNRDGYADVIVGSKNLDRVYVFHGSAAGLSETPSWTASGPTGSGFGQAVDTAGDVNGDGYADVIIGAPTYEDDGIPFGRAFVYHGSSSGLQTDPSWILQSDQPAANLGISVGAAGDVNGDGYDDVIIGAHTYKTDEIPFGLAVVFHGSATGLPVPESVNGLFEQGFVTPLDADWFDFGFSDGSQFGFAVGTAGDVNGDGFADVIVGSPAFEYYPGEGVPGAVYVYHGSPNGLSRFPDWYEWGYHHGSQFGYAVSAAGDVTGDGYGDVIIGVPQYTDSEAEFPQQETLEAEGAFFIYSGNEFGLDYTPLWIITGGRSNTRLGHAVSGGGDVNGDGFADVVVGAPDFVSAVFGRGVAFAFHGTGPIEGLTAVNSSPHGAGIPTLFRAETSSPVSGLNRFTWDFGDGHFGDERNAIHTYEMAGVYTATVTAQNPFGVVTATTLVTITEETIITPGDDGSLVYTDSQGRGTTVNVPPGAVDRMLLLRYTPIAEPTQPKPDGTINYYFDLDVDNLPTLYLPIIANGSASGGSMATADPSATCPAGHFCFQKPVTIVITYNKDLLDGQDENTLRLVFWSELLQQWVDAADTCSPASAYTRNPAESWFSVDICHITRFGVVGAN